MAQDQGKWHQKCRKCGAGVGEPCIVVIPSSYGTEKVADRVHYGRGNYYERRPITSVKQRSSPVRSKLFAETYHEIERRRFGD